jgi:hypothetical protein
VNGTAHRGTLGGNLNGFRKGSQVCARAPGILSTGLASTGDTSLTTLAVTPSGAACGEARTGRVGGYLVDSASSHMLVSKIKPCMSKYKQLYSETANGSLNQLSFI